MATPSLRVLREVVGLPPNVLNNIRGDSNLIEREDGSTWVDNDTPWDAEIVRVLMAHTGRFVLTDQFGGFVAGPYRDLAKAEAARASAKIQVVSVVETEDEEEVGAAQEAAASAGGGWLGA